MEHMQKLAPAFDSFSGGTQYMDGRQFMKLFKDSGVIGPKFTSGEADIIFAKVKQKGQRKISHPEFCQAVDLIAQKLKCGVGCVVEKISECAGPVLNATQTDAVRFHDDKSLYTGVHAHGGPSTIDSNVVNLSQLADRSAATIRGTKM